MKKEQAKAISLVVRKSHEVADLATKADINDVKRDIADIRKDLSAEIVDVCKYMEHRFEKTDAKIADVRKDIEHRFEKVEAQIIDSSKDTAVQIALLRKDVESISTWLFIKMAGIMAAIVGIATAIMKFL